MNSAVFLLMNIGTPELILILFVALLLFGGNKLPELARGLGKGIRDFKDASEGVKREIHNQINSFDEKPSSPAVRNDYVADTHPEATNSSIAEVEAANEPVITEKKEY